MRILGAIESGRKKDLRMQTERFEIWEVATIKV